MFNICRRGPASISRVLRTATSAVRIPSTRPSTLSLSTHITHKPALEARWLHVSSQLRNQAVAESQVDSAASQEFPAVTKFDDLLAHKLVHPNIVNAITKGMGHHTMTDVQSMTINQALQGTDIIAQARTGTGKTIGFLVPMLQNIIRRNPELAERKRYSNARASDIRAIIISPTRELAEQIATEAAKLCSATDLIVQIAVGGNSKRMMLSKTRREGCHILVATPGRLYDLLSDPYSGIRADQLTTLVLDEADRLLDDGFSKDIDEIKTLLPDITKVDRQTLLFSATVPREVMGLVKRTLKPDFHFVQTVKEGDLATHQKVPQNVVTVAGYENLMPAVYELCKRQVDLAAKGEGLPFKAIIYFQATASVQLAYRTFDNLADQSGGRFAKSPLYPAEISQIHGQLTQERRTNVTERFRRAKTGILFSTDVTARGMDFPNVTHVIQVGLPSNREQYIHRVGRTGRGDKTGSAYIFVHEAEMDNAARTLRQLPIKKDDTLETAMVDMTKDAQLPASVAEIITQVGLATKMIDRDTKQAAFMGTLGTMKGVRNGIDILNQWTKYVEVEEEAVHQAHLVVEVEEADLAATEVDSAETEVAEEDTVESRGGGFGGDRGGRGGSRFGGDRGGFGGDRGGRGGSRFGGDGDRGFGGSGGSRSGGFSNRGRPAPNDFNF
ncbi:P-loop containing nucleoside triphosphate hydrolase [Glarea lozoyensis ATCC 20868]|uniref:ATP-dependent RNA helicase n=1 Tax=Glarea lozoyensis (strain ATCC 20868 / MF5171) TaxID=1116229 RepID=S3DX28_GLAL2|nr:P-loop containing nucleoside triphosphate hydrolase [Glarea lozoyensis ATCC 20868]EPE30938.1 P-loop containing nucleoside triphosphate hydrolase [Glarea lozoyensis ATCC 20868]